MVDLLSGAAFGEVSDHQAADLRCLEWNPAMDLLATLSEPPDAVLTVWRLLAADPASKKVLQDKYPDARCLAWRPDGRRICLGDGAGVVTIIDPESAVTEKSIQMHSCPVETVTWINCEPVGQHPSRPCKQKKLPMVLPIPAGGSMSVGDDDEAIELYPGAEDNTCVVSAGEDASVGVLAAGVARVASVNLGAGPPMDGPIESALLSPDLRNLAVLRGPSGGQPGGVALLDSRILAVKRQEVLRASRALARVEALVVYIREGIQSLGTTWKRAVDAITSAVQSMRHPAITDPGALYDDLLQMCLTGSAGDGLMSFLSSEKKVKHMQAQEGAVLGALQFLSQMCCTRLQIAVLHLCTVLEELHTSAAYDPSYRRVGLDAAAIKEFGLKARQFLVHLEGAILAVADCQRWLSTLFRVTVRVFKKVHSQVVDLSDSPTADDLDFLVARLERGAPLDGSEVTAAIGLGANQPSPPDSLGPLAEEFTSSLARIAASMDTAISAAITPCAWVPIFADAPEQRIQPAARWGRIQDHTTLQVLWTTSTGGSAVHVASIALTPQQTGVSTELGRVSVGVGELGVKLQQWYDEDTVAVVLGSADATAAVLIDLSEQQPQPAASFLADGLPPASSLPSLAALGEEAARVHALPAWYAKPSALRVMASRGMLSVYSSTASRLISFDVDGGDGDEEEEEEEDDDAL
mmetsp:Transcript_4011/g.9659  ORF Transcript_4011/g.9659 Transcript_4011/m.9659 type:complete len:693 (+) Transcript_4011:14-2092(+)